jgi:hypothetical protein
MVHSNRLLLWNQLAEPAVLQLLVDVTVHMWQFLVSRVNIALTSLLIPVPSFVTLVDHPPLNSIDPTLVELCPPFIKSSVVKPAPTSYEIAKGGVSGVFTDVLE